MTALLYTQDEYDPDGSYVKFNFDPFDIKGCYRPADVEGCYNILLGGVVLTLVETPELKEYLSLAFKH